MTARATLCRNCPFRPRTFLPLSPADTARLIDFVETPGCVAVCHATLGARERPCGGAARFLAGAAGVFLDEGRMIRAHARSRRPIRGKLYGID